MIGYPLTQPKQFLLAEAPALTNHFNWHPQLLEEGEKEVPKKMKKSLAAQKATAFYRQLANAPARACGVRQSSGNATSDRMLGLSSLNTMAKPSVAAAGDG